VSEAILHLSCDAFSSTLRLKRTYARSVALQAGRSLQGGLICEFLSSYISRDLTKGVIRLITFRVDNPSVRALTRRVVCSRSQIRQGGGESSLFHMETGEGCRFLVSEAVLHCSCAAGCSALRLKRTRERGCPFSGDGGVRTSVACLLECVVCEEERDPSKTTTPAGCFVCDHAGLVINRLCPSARVEVSLQVGRRAGCFHSQPQFH